MLQYAKVKEEGSFICHHVMVDLVMLLNIILDNWFDFLNMFLGKYPHAVTNTYNVTKIHINEDTTQINEFLKRGDSVITV